MVPEAIRKMLEPIRSYNLLDQGLIKENNDSVTWPPQESDVLGAKPPYPKESTTVTVLPIHLVKESLYIKLKY